MSTALICCPMCHIFLFLIFRIEKKIKHSYECEESFEKEQNPKYEVYIGLFTSVNILHKTCNASLIVEFQSDWYYENFAVVHIWLFIAGTLMISWTLMMTLQALRRMVKITAYCWYITAVHFVLKALVLLTHLK